MLDSSGTPLTQRNCECDDGDVTAPARQSVGCDPTTRPESPRIATKCAPCAPNGPNHLGGSCGAGYAGLKVRVLETHQLKAAITNHIIDGAQVQPWRYSCNPYG